MHKIEKNYYKQKYHSTGINILNIFYNQPYQLS